MGVPAGPRADRGKRGRRRVFDRFEPSESALVVIDMQDFYVRDVPSAAL